MRNVTFSAYRVVATNVARPNTKVGDGCVWFSTLTLPPPAVYPESPYLPVPRRLVFTQ